MQGTRNLRARTAAQATLVNKSLRPTRIDVGSRSVRSVGSSTVMTWTATPLPSGNGSETISNRLPYILMWWEELYPRALILTQSSAVDLAILWFMTVPISCNCEILECGYDEPVLRAKVAVVTVVRDAVAVVAATLLPRAVV